MSEQASPGNGPDEAREARRRAWDERHRAGDFEGDGPNPTFVTAVAPLAPGRALELASGSGTNAVWLASQGWEVTAVDWSAVGIANGRASAERARVTIDWLERDLQAWVPPARSFDLVAIVYLHLPADERRHILAHAAAAVAPGGRLVIVGHDRTNAADGVGGPPDVDRLFTANELAAEVADVDPELVTDRADAVRRVAPPGRGPIDALLVMLRPHAASLAGDSAAIPALRPRRSFVPPSLGPRGEGWFVAQVALLGTAAIAGLATRAPAFSPVVPAAGIALILGGFVLALRGVLDLRDNLTVFPRPRAGARLVDRGAYRLVRHPIYGGLILGAIGWGMVTASPAALAAAAGLALLLGLKSVREEAWLAAAFPGYEAYRRRTRRLIPWVI